jgi:adenosine deaminase
MKKTDLHMHLTGAYPLEYLREVSTRKDFLDLEENLKSIANRRICYDSIFRVFSKVEKIIDNESKIFGGVCALYENLSAQEVIYTEIRTGLKDLGKGKRAYLEELIKSLDASKRKYGVECSLILSIKRNTNNSEVLDTLKIAEEYHDLGVVGLDICGKEENGDLKRITSLINTTKRELPITLHLGEIKYGVSLEDIKNLCPSRVSHAVHISKEIKDFIKSHNIPMEICISSNFYTGLVPSLYGHPVRDYYLEGMNISICSDDPLIFQTNTSLEYNAFRKVLNLTDEDLILITKKSILSSFASEQTKTRLIKSLEKNDKRNK